MKNFLGNWFKLFLITVGFFVVSAGSASAATYNWYFSQSGSDSTGDGSIGKPWKSLVKVESQIDSITNGADAANIFLKRGDTWTFTSDADCLRIKRSNVTIDAYGSGAKPIFDGAGSYPSTYLGYAIAVAGDVYTVSNTTIRNLRIQNMYPGQGIIFNGADGNLCSGPALVEYVDGYMLGGNLAYIYGIINTGGSSNAIKIEHCSANKCGETFRRGETPLGTCAIGWYYNSGGHEVRYCNIWDCSSEGIDAPGAAICEYNTVTDTQSTSIYYEPGYQNAGKAIIRYNLIWNKSGGSYNGAELRIDDEVYAGDNSGSDIQVYGNVIIGGYAGIDIRNNPTWGGTAYSNWGSIKVYNNTFIDTLHNYVIGYPERFTGPVVIKNNASIIYPDAATISEHISYWGQPIGSAFTIGPNFFYGDGATSNSNLISAFQNPNNVFGTFAPLPKTSGWRGLTSLNDFSFSDFYPSETSQLINRPQTEQIPSFDRYLTIGTNWETLPAGTDFVLAGQDMQGTDWDFGAIIRQETTPPAEDAISRSAWTVHYVDSEETDSPEYPAPATNAIDGATETIWHSGWHLASDPQPHEIQINMGASYLVTGFRYLPRQDWYRGRIAQYEFYVSADGTNWGSPVAAGTWDNSIAEKEVRFASKAGHFIRIKSLSSDLSEPYTTVAELNVLGSLNTSSDTTPPAAPTGLNVQ